MLDAPLPPPPETFGWAQVQASFGRLFTGQEQIQQTLTQHAQIFTHLTQRVDYLYDYHHRWDRSWETGHSSQPVDEQPDVEQPAGDEQDDMQQG